MCPFGSVKAETDGYRIYLGGRWGKKTAHGIPMQKIFTDKEEVMKTVEKAILLFRDQGITGERFADMVERMGMEKIEGLLLSDELLEHKEENLAAQKHLKGGATC